MDLYGLGSSPLPLIFTCTLLLVCQTLILAALTTTQRRSQRRRYNQRLVEYGKTGLDPDTVPKPLQELIPLAKKWEAQDSPERQHLQRTATQADKLDLSRQMVGHEDLILEWLRSFNGQPLTREAVAYAAMLLSFQEMQLIVDDRYLPDNETSEVAFAHPARASAPLPRAKPYKPRFLKSLPAWAYFGVFIPGWIGGFIIWGKLWSMLFPYNESITAFGVVSFLAALTAGIVTTLVDRWYGTYKG